MLRTFTLSALLLVAACSSGSGDLEGVMFIESCSLGCNNGSAGTSVFCQVINTSQNQDIAVVFSQPIDPGSVDAATFRIVQSSNGTSPPGQRIIDPADPRRLIFRPALTFDLNGSPIYGLLPNTSYQLTIPGEGQGDSPPFIRSTSGRGNQSRLQCTVFTDQPVQDPVVTPEDVRVAAQWRASIGLDDETVLGQFHHQMILFTIAHPQTALAALRAAPVHFAYPGKSGR